MKNRLKLVQTITTPWIQLVISKAIIKAKIE